MPFNRNSHISSRRSARGFTLLELLVVVGIILILLAVLIPTITGAMKSGQRTRATAQLQSIITALEAYKTDFNGYPQTSPDSTTTPSDDSINASGLRGARVLAKSLVGPQDGATPSGGLLNADRDGENGDGFRVPDRTGSGAGILKKPYLTGVYAKVSNTSATGDLVAGTPYLDTAVLLDPWGKPVLYFPQNANAIAFTTRDSGTATDGYGGVICDSVALPASSGAMYDLADNREYLKLSSSLVAAAEQAVAARRNLSLTLGDANANGFIDGGERLGSVQQPYLLWSGGPDQFFGVTVTTGTADQAVVPKNFAKIDDVTNLLP